MKTSMIGRRACGVAALLLLCAFWAPTARADSYAVLINGGYNVASGSPSYWNDLSAMYRALKSPLYGFTDSNIFVLSADGTSSGADVTVLTNYSSALHKYQSSYTASSPLDLDGNGTVDIDYAATRANLSNVFTALGSTMTASDSLFVYTTDHGGTNGGENAKLYLWGETITDSQFAAEVAKVQNYAMETFLFQQCYSGGFLDNLAGGDRILMSASRYDQESWGWVLGDPGVNGYSEFSHQFTLALAGAGDLNGDRLVSIREAYDYALLNDYFGPSGTGKETPQYINHDNIGMAWTLAGPLAVPEAMSAVMFGTGVTAIGGFMARWRMRRRGA